MPRKGKFSLAIFAPSHPWANVYARQQGVGMHSILYIDSVERVRGREGITVHMVDVEMCGPSKWATHDELKRLAETGKITLVYGTTEKKNEPE